MRATFPSVSVCLSGQENEIKKSHVLNNHDSCYASLDNDD